ncbi:pirin family protein [Corynebacterium sp. A21]|uniref:pirin family protein n=1 Tax=Corynebacterium sp. A21 TaxID=3457318 RepID=UPI003FCF70E0
MSNTELQPAEFALSPEPSSGTIHCEGGADVEIITSREVPLGGPRAMLVRRTLPQRQRSLIGAWCFVDHYGPDDVSLTDGMDVAPHPHTGLQTVTWLFEGDVEHHDSGDVHARVQPGEVNLMTAGAGICHSEVSTPETTTLHGVQLWTVLPDADRQGPRRFDHHAPKPVHFPGGQALVFLGSLLGYESPVKTFTPLVGAEIRLDAGGSLELEVNPEHEHGLLVDSGDIDLEGVKVAPTELAYTGIGETRLRIRNNGQTPALLMLIGGTPFTEEVVMWWNFIGRNHEEISRYRQEWEEHGDRFGETQGYVGLDPAGPDRLPAPKLPNAAIKPRKNPEPKARPKERN